MKWNNISQESKIYLGTVIFGLVALFVVTSAVFLGLTADKLDIIMHQNAKLTCSYFISILDRILLFFVVFIVIPVTIFHLKNKNKNKFDKIISVFSLFVFFILFSTFICGEYYFYNAYKNGELNDSKLFSPARAEYKIFDKLLNKS